MKTTSNWVWGCMLAVSFVGASAQAGMQCEGATPSGKTLKLSVSDRGTAEVEVIGASGGTELRESFVQVADVWDGHMTGLMTAPGLAVKYENHFGVVRNVVVTTNTRAGIGFIESVFIPSCLTVK